MVPGAMLELRRLRADERKGFLDLMQVAFEERELFRRYLEHDPQLGDDDTLVALDQGRLVASVQIFTRTIRLRGEPVLLGGIGSVATHPDYERQGIATRLVGEAIDEMRRREMPLALLFTSRVDFYERLDWLKVDHPVLVVRRARAPARSAGRPFRPGDLPDVARLYDAYSQSRQLTTVRGADYWRGQLSFAGNPDEEFRVSSGSDGLDAYVRRIDFMGYSRVSEYARAPGAASRLAALLLTMAPRDRALLVPAAGDPDLVLRLRAAGASTESARFPDQMWRILDRPRLAALAGLPESRSDRQLVEALVDRDDAVYWPSDRF
jgi:predicted N-acetyltransferase YhbS